MIVYPPRGALRSTVRGARATGVHVHVHERMAEHVHEHEHDVTKYKYTESRFYRALILTFLRLFMPPLRACVA